MAYRDMEVTPPARPPLNLRPMDRNVAESRRGQQHEEDVRHRRCASLGGTWHEGFVAGHRSSWCSVVGR